MKATLDRFASTSHGTFGILTFGNHSLYTCEEEWQDNKSNISCIPAGEYVCKRRMYYGGGYETFEVTNVPGRSAILFHIGNTEEDLDGCIAPGHAVGVLKVRDEDSGLVVPKLAVLQSRLAFNLFMNAMRGIDTFPLTITDPRA